MGRTRKLPVPFSPESIMLLSNFKFVPSWIERMRNIPVVQNGISAVQQSVNILRGVVLKHFMPKNWLSYQIEKKLNLILIRQALDKCEKELNTPIPEFVTSGKQSYSRLRVSAELIRHWVLTYSVPIIIVWTILSLLFLFDSTNAKIVLEGIPLLAMLSSILVIGIPIITTFAMFRTGGKWGQESLHHNTNIDRFVTISLINLLLAILNALIVYGTNTDNSFMIISLLALTGIVIGLAVGTLLTSAAIILEVVKFARNSEFAWCCAGRYATNKFLKSCLLDMYIKYFMHEYHNILDIICEEYCHLAGPSKHISMGFLGNGASSKEILAAKPFNIKYQYVDYYLPYLSDMNRLAIEKCLTISIPHHYFREKTFTENMLVAELQPANIDIDVDDFSFAPRYDKYLSLEQWDKDEIEDAFLRQVATYLENNDRYGFRKLFESLSRAIDSFAKIWGNESIRRMEPSRSRHIQDEVLSSDDLYTWARLYSEALKLLLYNPPTIDHAPYSHQYQFMRCLRECYHEQIVRALESGQPDIMSIFLRYAPKLHQIASKYIIKADEGKESEDIKKLKNLSAQWGKVFAFTAMYFKSVPPSTSNSDRIKFLVYLQRTASDWIIDTFSPESKDYEDSERRIALLRQLCKAMGDIIDISFDCVSSDTTDAHEALLHTHWWITGTLLNKDDDIDLQKKQQEILVGLCSSKLLQQSPQELLSFYCKHPLYEERLGRRSPFEDNMREYPLDGSLSGAGFIDMYRDEMRISLLFFLAKCAEGKNYAEEQLPQAIPLEIRAVDFNGAIKKVKKACPEYYHPWILKWLASCENKYTLEEEERVIAAELDPSLKRKFIKDFDKGFQEGLTVIQTIIDERRFRIQKGIGTRLEVIGRNWINKKFFLPQSAGGYGIERGNEFGRDMAKSLDCHYFSVLKENIPDKSISMHKEANMHQLVEFAVDWLKGRGCGGKDGLILCSAESSIRRTLWESEAFVPAWRETNLPKGYIGTCHGFRVWGQNCLKEQKITVIAVDLSKWEPIIFDRSIESTGNWWQSTIIPVDDEYVNEIEKNHKDVNKLFNKNLYLENCRLEVEYDIDFNLVDAGEHCMLFCSKEETAGAQDTNDEDE